MLFRSDSAEALPGTVSERVSLPPRDTVLISVRVGEQEINAQTTGNDGLRVGDLVWLTFRRYHVFDKASGVRLRSHQPRAH